MRRLGRPILDRDEWARKAIPLLTDQPEVIEAEVGLSMLVELELWRV